jgi:hypothetical protein
MGVVAEEICRFFQTQGPTIFPKRGGIQRWLGRVRDVFLPKFSNESLRAVIRGWWETGR